MKLTRNEIATLVTYYDGLQFDLYKIQLDRYQTEYDKYESRIGELRAERDNL